MRAVLFDFAGTLCMPRSAEEQVLRAAGELGVELGAAEAARLAAAYAAAGLPGGPYPASVPAHLAAAYAARDVSAAAHRAAYVELLGSVPAPAAGFAEAMYAQVAEPGHWVPYADAHEVVAALGRAGIVLGVISNVGFDLRPILRAHAFPDLAERCTLSFEHGAAKPDPALFEAALRTLGAEPADTLVVGDHPADAGAAVLGCRALLLPMSPPGARHGLDAVLRLVPG